ncbi:hypothetical protein J3459_010521 [Metarhizium acridum]|nr:hypothetical protein J3459_010521 [Metarhizium acridum]
MYRGSGPPQRVMTWERCLEEMIQEFGNEYRTYTERCITCHWHDVKAQYNGSYGEEELAEKVLGEFSDEQQREAKERREEIRRRARRPLPDSRPRGRG